MSTARGRALHVEFQPVLSVAGRRAGSSERSDRFGVSGRVSFSRTRPPVAAAAINSAGFDSVGHDAVLASVQRVDALDDNGCRALPSDARTIAMRHSARSTISGSRAEFSSLVVPRASVAAIIDSQFRRPS
jgi:hypothetical protein